MEPAARRWDLEALLRSPAKRAALAALLALGLAAFGAGTLHAMFQGRRMEIAWSDLFAQQLIVYGSWALAGWPLFALARWLRRRTRSWMVFFALQLPLSLAVATGASLLHDAAQDELLAPPRGPREELAQEEDGRRPAPQEVERGERRGPRGFGPGRGGDRERIFFVTRTRSNVAIYWMVLGLGAIVSGFLHGRERERLASDLELRTSRMQTELARAQLGALQGQVRPHFLFNALHTVGGLVQQERGAEATRVLIALGDLLRASLEQEGRQEVTLREELRIAEGYLDVERVRFGPRLAVEVSVEPGCSAALVPAMLLQPLLENAVRHGVAPRTEGGRIEVRARREGDELVVELRDDGPGFPASVLAGEDEPGGRRGIGLANVRERMQLLYGARHSFALANDPAGGAVVTVRLPFHTEEAPLA